MSTHVLGIDLGTTNCVVASIVDGKPVLLHDNQGQVLFPSVVTLGDNDRVWTCSEAVALGATAPGRTAYAVKRLLGRWFQDEVVQRAIKNYAYQITENPSGGGVLIHLGNKTYSPEAISGLVLSELKQHYGRQFGQEPTEAVITVPAYFSHSQREGTKRAAHEAGLKVLRLLNEPTAAALSLPRSDDEERVVAVYDFGGGTFDFSVIRIQSNVYEVLATDGDTFLGGEDIDGLLCDELSRSFEESAGVKLRNFPLSWYRLRDAAEKAKKELSHYQSCSIFLPRLVGDESLVTELSLERVEKLTQPLLERSIEICQRTMETAQLRCDQLSDVVLVGGQTRMPLLRRMVEEYFGKAPKVDVNPDTAVAEGAAREAAMLRQGTGALLLDVTPITLGINIAGNRMYPLIPRNTKIPTRREHSFTTHRDAQTRARMVVLQGDHDVATENTRLGEIVLERLRGFERFQARILVVFEIDANGLLKVHAVDQDTGEEREVAIRDSFNPDGGEQVGSLNESESIEPADTSRRPTFNGPFRATELIDVLYFLHANHKTGRVELESSDLTGSLWLLDGEFSHAQLPSNTGKEALIQLLSLQQGNYAFHESECLDEPPQFEQSFTEIVESIPYG